ncbi:ABC-type lipoprotein export system ATPase subunit [Peptoniphilus ivorii]|uniref:ATP-binding cassette domain-containing protein n=1 Tax=Aedoeadaptatus ivorii TaxID=54006 RepID=UPI00277EF388|nr:ATP-binding cassette domain-containing protein [Peptoniphilus ivorii]MDQ0508584.1 ABC-type lipoprotein export system ATPase subunit [Peptoniphilus ivorii]
MLLQVQHLKKVYKTRFSLQSTEALKDVNFSVEAGEFIAIMGESGSGDSDIMMTDTINPLKSKFKGFHKTFKQDDLGLSLSSFLLN